MKLVIAATGNIGTATVKTLTAKNEQVIAAGRDLSKLKERFRMPGVDHRQFDFTDESTWKNTLKGADSMFLVVPPGSVTAEQQEKFLSAAVNAGIGHLVFSSGRTTGVLEGSPLHVTEGLVKKSGADWTIIRPGWFMQNFINWYGKMIIEEDALYVPANKAQTAFVDVRDIAAVATEILTHPAGHRETVYDITGPESLDHFEIAQQISHAAGRKVSYLPSEDEIFMQRMMKTGWTEKTAGKVAWLYGFVRDGNEAEVSKDAERILGRKPGTFAAFAKDHAEAWKNPPG